MRGAIAPASPSYLPASFQAFFSSQVLLLYPPLHILSIQLHTSLIYIILSLVQDSVCPLYKLIHFVRVLTHYVTYFQYVSYLNLLSHTSALNLSPVSIALIHFILLSCIIRLFSVLTVLCPLFINISLLVSLT